jgi:hypothetical protein
MECRGSFLILPLGLNFDPRDEVVPQEWILSPGAGGEVIPGVKFSVRPSILLNSRECSPLGVNAGVNEGVNTPPRGQISPPGARGGVKNGPLIAVGFHRIPRLADQPVVCRTRWTDSQVSPKAESRCATFICPPSKLSTAKMSTSRIAVTM